MFKRLVVLVPAVIATAIIVGCGAKTTSDKPLTGLVIRQVEITGGDQSQVVQAAIWNALLENGASMAFEPSPDAVFITGEYFAANTRFIKPAILSVELCSKGYVITTSVEANFLAALLNTQDGLLTAMAKELGERVAEGFVFLLSLSPPKSEKKITGLKI